MPADNKPPRVRIQALGGYRIVVDGRDLRLRTRKEATLLLRLAIADDAGASRDECVALLWPDSSEARARHSLSEALRGIELATRLEMTRTPDRLTLPPSSIAFDVRELEAAIETGDVMACMRLHTGGFLAGWYPPTAEASHWVDGVAASLAVRLEKSMRRELEVRRKATDSRGVTAAVTVLERLDVATEEDLEAAAEAEQVTAWESLRPGESIHPRIPFDREGPFVGRVEEMKVLTSELERAMSGELRVVLVSGEAGIGKTRTCQRLARLAALRGARLFLSTCYELEQSFAYGAIGEAFAGAVTPSDVAGLKPAWRRALAELMPGIEPTPADDPPVGPAGNVGLYSAFAELMRGCCNSKPGFLLIDDLHWADASSCQVLHYIGRSEPPPAGLLVVLAYRPEAMRRNGPASTLIRSNHSAGTTVNLSPMSKGDIQKQVESLWPEGVGRVEKIALIAGGNPFFALELARSEANSREEDAESSLSEAILSRADRLGPSDRFLLEALAVAGTPLTPIQLSVIAGEPLLEVTRSSTRLRSVGLLTELGPSLTVAHDIIKDTIYRSLREPVRRSMHAAIASALSPHAAPELLAQHFAAADLREEARENALSAATRSRSRRAYDEEVSWLMLALENTTDEIPQVLNHIADRMFDHARYSDLVSLLGRHARSMDKRLRLKRDIAVLKSRATAEWLSGGRPTAAYVETLSKCDRIFASATADKMGMEAIEALREKMRVAQEAADTPMMLGVAEKLFEYRHEVEDPQVAVQAAAISLMKIATYQPRVLGDRISLVHAEFDDGHDDLGPPSFALGMAEALNAYVLGSVASAGAKLHQLVRRARAAGDPINEVRCRALMVPTSVDALRYGRAIRHAEYVFEYARYAEARWEHLVTLLNLTVCYWEVGDHARARECADELLRLEKEQPIWLVRCHATAIIGLLSMEAGDTKTVDRCEAVLAESLPPISDWTVDMSSPVAFLVHLAVLRDRREEAVAMLNEVLTNPRGIPAVFRWEVELQRARMGTADRETIDRVHAEAKAGGARLMERKVEYLISQLGHQIQT